jgi:hypothetical protein
MKNPTSNLRVLTLGRRNGRALVKVIDSLGEVVDPKWANNLEAALDSMQPHHRGVRFVVTTEAISIFKYTLCDPKVWDMIPSSTYDSLSLAFRMASSDLGEYEKEIR